MTQYRTAGILLLVAGAAFLVAGLLEQQRSPLRFIAAGALMLAGILRLMRARRP
jgi:hypothetical protein